MTEAIDTLNAGAIPSHRGADFRRQVAAALAQELKRATTSVGYAMSGLMPMQGSTAFSSYCVPAIIRDQAESPAVQALHILRKFRTWGDNWDAEGAPAPSAEAIDIAQNLLGHLKSFAVAPTAMLDSQGNPLLLLRYGGMEGEINVYRNALIDFMLQMPGSDPEFEADLPTEGGVPAPLDEALRKLMAALPA